MKISFAIVSISITALLGLPSTLADDSKNKHLRGTDSSDSLALEDNNEEESHGDVRKLQDMGPLYFSERSYCYGGYKRADNTGLNGDLNQGAGGKDIFLCLANDFESRGVTSLKLVQNSGSCGSEYNLAKHVSSLNGDLNQGAGGKDIFLCYSSSSSRGSPIATINIREQRPPQELLPLRPDGLNGDLNQSAGGKDIFFVIYRKEGGAMMGPLYFSEDPGCFGGYKRAPQSANLNGDLNQSSGGKDIFLCLANDFEARGVTGLKLVQNTGSCGSGYNLARHVSSLNGDLNQGAGGKDIFLCYSTSPSEGSTITSIDIHEQWPSQELLPSRPDGLNGDLNQSAGGKDIFFVITRKEANEFGGKQAGFCVRSDGQDQNSGVHLLESGDFDGPEQQAYCLQKCAEFPNHTGCEAIWDQGNRGCYVHTEEVARGNGVANHACWIAVPVMGPLYLSEDPACIGDYKRAPQAASLNGDLNQGSGGKDIFLCIYDDLESQGVTGLKLVQNTGSCGPGFNLVKHVSSLNGDLNQGAGGKDIFLCYSKSHSGDVITNVYVREQHPLDERMPLRPDGLNGDLNQSAGGKDIFLEIYRKDANSDLPGQNSLPAVTNYHFGGYPQPGYLPVEVCGGFIFEFGCTNYGPCWHAQQLVSFADADNLYTFFTMSQSRHGKAYLLKAPLTKNPSAAWPAVPSDGTVEWYEETTDFNHPGDLVIKDRIILTANQNWEVTDDLQNLGCGFVEGVTLGGGGCNCFSDLASKKQALTIWDFSQSLYAPQRHEIDKWAFNSIIDGEMDGSDADNLWGGDVNGELVIEFENYWLHYKGGNLGSISSWEEIAHVDIPSCSGEIGSGAGKLFAKINGKSYLASMDVDDPCYSLRPVTYDVASKTLTVDCAGMIKQCTPGGQLVDSNDKKRAFQTITEGPDGRVYMTALNIYGTATQVMVSDS